MKGVVFVCKERLLETSEPLLIVQSNCVMLTKCVFFRFSRPGNALSKFCAK
jgi:hypothetical protein